MERTLKLRALLIPNSHNQAIFVASGEGPGSLPTSVEVVEAGPLRYCLAQRLHASDEHSLRQKHVC